MKANPFLLRVLTRFSPFLTFLQCAILTFHSSTPYIMWKVRQFLYRPGRTLRIPGGTGSQILKQSAHEGGKVVSPTQRPPLPPPPPPPQDIFLVLISVRGWVDPRVIMQPEGLRQWKVPVTPLKTEPATFRLVAQCLNQLRHRPRNLIVENM